MSGVRWLTTSSSEIARAREVLKALRPGGVIDELGFLILTDAFSERLYPAVTTPMTRARYLLLVPAIYLYLERSGRAIGRDADRLARDLQFGLLERVRSEMGAIGKESGRAIVRPPAEIYWGALAALGLATRRTSLATYHRQLEGGEFRPLSVRDDDAAVHPDETPSLWDLKLRVEHLLEEGTFPEGTTLRLRKGEARLLRDRYSALCPDGNRSLIASMVELGALQGLASVEGVEFPWGIPEVTGPTARTIRHARLLSLFGRGTTLQYHYLLLKKKGLQLDNVIAAFSDWWAHAREDMDRWDLDDFFLLVGGWHANRRPVQDRRFLTVWIERIVEADSGLTAIEDPSAQRSIAEREDSVRPGKQRLRVKHQLDSWQPVQNYGLKDWFQFGYRHSVGRQFAHDIVEGLQRGGA